MKLKLIILLLLPVIAFSQADDLQFNKQYQECENNWTVFPHSNKDTTFVFGYIYNDKDIGFTFYKEGYIGLSETGKFTALPLESAVGIRIKLIEGLGDFAILPNDKIAEMGLAATPSWYKEESQDTTSIEDYLKKGIEYNNLGECNKALIYLESAYIIDANSIGLVEQLAYAYRVTKQYQKVIDVLVPAIAINSSELLYYEELAIAYIRLDNMQKAEEISLQALDLTKDKKFKTQISINMADAYFQLKDKDNFKVWSKKTKKYAKSGSKEMGYLKYFKKNI